MQVYIVQKGDNIDKIINKFAIPYQKLKTLNPNVDLTRLQVGTKLYIVKQTHTIAYKDSCVDL